MAKKKARKAKEVKPIVLVSRVDYPIRLSLSDGTALMLSPRAKVTLPKGTEPAGELPSGVIKLNV